MSELTRKIIKVVSHGVTAGGLFLVGRSLTNPNPAFDQEMAERGAIVFDAREKYHIGQRCYSGFGIAACVDVVLRPGTKTEHDAILAQYQHEVVEAEAKVRIDPEAHRQAERDGANLLIGLPTTAIGLIGIASTSGAEQRKGRQFQNRKECREGRHRKEF